MIDIQDIGRELAAVNYAAERLGYNVREVSDRMDKIARHVMVQPYAPEVRQFIINMRGWDVPPQFATSAWLDLQLERLIDLLASDAETAEIAEIASRG